MSEQRETASGRKHGRMRWFVRGTCLAAAIAILLLSQQRWWPVVVPGLSPFVGLTALLARRAVQASLLLGLAVGLIVLVRPRWFCRWVCPAGFCADGVSRFGQRLGRGRMRPAPIGQWVLWMTVGGACVGLPLLLWLDPLALFGGFLRLPPCPAALIIVAPAMGVAVLSLLWPHAWCSQACPLGALQDVLSRLARRRGTRETPGGARPLARRAVLGAAIGAITASVLRLTGAKLPRPVRPPGAVDEATFAGLCIRCGNCVRACPTRIVKTDVGGHGLRSLLTPVLRFEAAYCREDCTACTQVCPSGALVRLSIEAKGQAPLGVPKVDMSVCLLGDERECSECKRWCPHAAIRYVFSETEYTLVPVIDPAKCTGCGACEMACPVRPKKAIVVVPLGDKATG